jgi:hypothetical protein
MLKPFLNRYIMKPLLLVIVCIAAIFGCKSTKNAGTISGKDSKVYQLLAAASKGNTTALQNLPLAYEAARQDHLDKISIYSKDTVEGKWDAVLHELESLQMMYDSISAASCCNKLPSLTNYATELFNNRSAAAEYWYANGNLLRIDTTTKSVRKAYAAFEKAESYLPGYKDAKAKMDDLYDAHVFIVAFNPVEDSSFFETKGLPPRFYTFCNELLISRFIKETDPAKSPIPFLKLLTVEECRRTQTDPDWLIDLTIPEFYIDVQTKTKSLKKTEYVQTGTDSSGRAIYQSRVYYEDIAYDEVSNARLTVQMDIVDYFKGKTVMSKQFGSVFNTALNRSDSWLYDDKSIDYYPTREKTARQLFFMLYRQYHADLNRTLYN